MPPAPLRDRPENVSSPPSARPRQASITLALTTLLIVLAVVLVWRNHGSPAQAHIEAGNDFAARGATWDAVREWRAAVAVEPQNILAWQLLAKSYYETGQWAAARDALLQVQRLGPDTPHVYSLLATSVNNLGDNGAAVGYAREALKHDPDDIPALQIVIAIGLKQGNAGDVVLALRRLTVLQPDKTENWTTLAQILIGRNSVVEAISVLDHVLAADPGNAQMTVLRGVARYTADGSRAGQQAAEADLKRALDLDPALYPAWLYLGRIYRRQGQLDRAAHCLERAVRQNPQRQDAYFDLAAVYELARDPARAAVARRHFEAIAAADERYTHLKTQCAVAPDDFELNLNVGLMALQRSEHKPAGTFLARARALRPNDPRVVSALRAWSAQKTDAAKALDPLDGVTNSGNLITESH